jgi:hypothetical protein
MVYVKISFPPVVEFDIAFASHPLCRTRVYGGLDPILEDLKKQSQEESARKKSDREILGDKSGLHKFTIEVEETNKHGFISLWHFCRWTKSESCIRICSNRRWTTIRGLACFCGCVPVDQSIDIAGRVYLRRLTFTRTRKSKSTSSCFEQLATQNVFRRIARLCRTAGEIFHI